MIYKIQRLFEKYTNNLGNVINNSEELDNFLLILKRRKMIIEHDTSLFRKFITDFPINFINFCAFINQIYQLEIEKTISNQINSVNNDISNLFSFIHKVGGIENLNENETSSLLNDLLEIKNNIALTKKNFNLVKFELQNLREEVYRVVWGPIKHNLELITNKYNSENKKNLSNELIDLIEENMIANAMEYQAKYKMKIEYEYEIIKTKKVHFDKINKVYKPRMFHKIAIENTNCSDRGIPIETWRIPFNYFDTKVISRFFYKCEAHRELLLSKHFQKFTGYDDFSSDESHVYFFEFIEGSNLKNLLISRELEIYETSMLFIYLAKEILTAFRDLLYKSTHSFDLPITIDNIFYETNQQRLYLHNINFNNPRSNISESHEMFEAKLLFQYGMILIELLSVSIPEMKLLLEKIKFYSHGEIENNKMKIIYERITDIEEFLSTYLDNDVVVGIIIECLVTPYKSQLLFNEFYKSKNILKIILNSNCHTSENQEIFNQEKINKKEICQSDVVTAFEPYYHNVRTDESSKSKNVNKEENNYSEVITLNLLLFHPLFLNYSYDEKFISNLFKDI